MSGVVRCATVLRLGRGERDLTRTVPGLGDDCRAGSAVRVRPIEQRQGRSMPVGDLLPDRAAANASRRSGGTVDQRWCRPTIWREQFRGQQWTYEQAVSTLCPAATAIVLLLGKADTRAMTGQKSGPDGPHKSDCGGEYVHFERWRVKATGFGHSIWANRNRSTKPGGLVGAARDLAERGG